MPSPKPLSYTIDPRIEPKALSYFHRPDGVVVGLWKSAWSALSADEGRSWTPLVQSKTLWTNNAKIWAQRTEDGRYALVYNHSATRKNRFPVSVMTSDDGHAFDDLLCLHGEVSPIRYHGIHKNVGTQYFRAIVEGNGDPPGRHMWNTYSMNKEDIWVSRTRVPITGSVSQAVSEDFESTGNEADLELWNLHMPQWAPISIAEDPLSATGNRALELRDEDPWEYALAEGAFPEAGKAVLVQQCRVLGNRPYPYVLHRAHEAAPVTWQDRQQVANVSEMELRNRRLAVGEASQKQALKDLRTGS